MPSSGRSWNMWVKKCGGTVRTPHGQERCTSPFIPSQHSPLTFGFCLNPRCDSFWRTKGVRLNLPLPVQLTPFQAMMLEEHEHEGHVTLPPSPGHRLRDQARDHAEWKRVWALQQQLEEAEPPGPGTSSESVPCSESSSESVPCSESSTLEIEQLPTIEELQRRLVLIQAQAQSSSSLTQERQATPRPSDVQNRGNKRSNKFCSKRARI